MEASLGDTQLRINHVNKIQQEEMHMLTCAVCMVPQAEKPDPGAHHGEQIICTVSDAGKWSLGSRPLTLKQIVGAFGTL